MSKIKTELTKITPKMAAQFLLKNKKNRKLRKTHVDFLARAMQDGKFETTHQGIAFDSAGNLSDGQHRLAAIVQSGTTQTMLVSENVSAQNLDNGLGRTLTDLTGEDRAVTSIVGLLYRVVLGRSRPLVHEAEVIIDAFRSQLNI